MKRLDRRQLLRGTGAIVALPFLESLAVPKQGHAAERSAKSPMRMVCIGLEYGLYPNDFFLRETGRDYELPRLLSPLAALKNDFTVFSDLDHPGITDCQGLLMTSHLVLTERRLFPRPRSIDWTNDLT